MRTESELLVDCLQRLNRLGVPYMLVGSMASNYWGIPRSTHDLDFVLVLQHADVEPFVSAFSAGFFVQRESVRSAFSPPHDLYAAAYRTLAGSEGLCLETWAETLTLRQALPTLPLWIMPEVALPMDLELTYQAACAARRIVG